MNVKFESRFEKDLKLVKDRNLLRKLKQIILPYKQSKSLGEINNLKKMQGYDSFYRIRLGDYRIGIEVFENAIIFARFLPRKDIYKLPNRLNLKTKQRSPISTSLTAR